MIGQPFYYQPPRVVLLPNPFLYNDYSNPLHGYWGSHHQDVIDERLDNPRSDCEAINPMSNYVEYSDDYINAGPTSFPIDEHIPSTQEMLHAQNMVQIACPPDLLLDHQGSDNCQSILVNLPMQDVLIDTNSIIDDTMRLEIQLYQAEITNLELVNGFLHKQVSLLSISPLSSNIKWI